MDNRMHVIKDLETQNATMET